MGKFSEANLFGMTIRESANDGSDFTNPDADYRRLFLGEDGDLHLKDSAGTVTDVGSGAAQEHNEIDAAVLVNATSTGDAGARADHFPGTSLDAAWVAEATALSAGPTVKYSALAMVGPGSAAAHHRLRAYTPSGAFRVEARMRAYTTSTFGAGLLVRDSGTGDSTGDGMLLDLNATASNLVAYSLDTGTYTSRGTSTAIPWSVGQQIYLAWERNGSNAWTAQASMDRAHWVSVLSGHSKTFTVAKVGFRVFNAMIVSVDFFDVVS